jgi:Aspartyl/Asparaginyl beta-hydroxylase
MSKPIELLSLGVPTSKQSLSLDVSEIATYLDTCPYWNLHSARTVKDGPHAAVDDIWARWIQPGREDFIWYYRPLTALLKPLVKQVYSHVGATELGGVLVTRIPPREQVLPHIDTGWHAETFSKYCICVKADEKQKFCFEGHELVTHPGSVFWFDNSYRHWVINNSDRERISLIVCLKTPQGIHHP